MKSQISLSLMTSFNQLKYDAKIRELTTPLKARIAKLEAALDKVNNALVNLFAMVNGEVPSLLEDDHHYDMCLDAIALAAKVREKKDG